MFIKSICPKCYGSGNIYLEFGISPSCCPYCNGCGDWGHQGHIGPIQPPKWFTVTEGQNYVENLLAFSKL